MSHSRAPWNGGGDVVLDADGREVCTVNRKRKGSTGFVPLAQWRADSKLIAAAPDLQSLCIALYEAFPEIETDEELSGADAIDRLSDLWADLRRALEKAGQL